MISVFLPAPPPQKDTTLLANCILNTNIPHFSLYNTSLPTKIVEARYNPREKTQELETGYQSMLRTFKPVGNLFKTLSQRQALFIEEHN
jgi:hypothetical protein